MRDVRFAVLLAALFILGSVASIPLAHAATCTWDGSNSTWETASHWSCGHVPTSGDDATISSGTVTVTADENIGSGAINSLIINGATLIVNAGVTLTTTNRIDISGGGTLKNMGTIAVGDLILNDGGTVTNMGTITLATGLGNFGVTTNYGTITVTGPGGFLVNGDGGTITNFGHITVSGYIDNTNGTINNCGGTISQTGSFTGNPIVNGCAVVGGEVFSLDYGSLMFSAIPWILIIATLAAAGAIILRQKFKLLI